MRMSAWKVFKNTRNADNRFPFEEKVLVNIDLGSLKAHLSIRLGRLWKLDRIVRGLIWHIVDVARAHAVEQD